MVENQGPAKNCSSASASPARSAYSVVRRWLAILSLEIWNYLKNDPKRFAKDCKEIRTSERWILYFTVGGLIIAALTIRVFRGQLEVMTSQLVEMKAGGRDTYFLAMAAKRQADKAETISTTLHNAVQAMDANNLNAKRSLIATINQFHLEQRAWLGFDGETNVSFTEKDSFKATLNFINTGKSPAERIFRSMAYIASRKALLGLGKDNISRLKFRPTQSIAPQEILKLRVNYLPGAELMTPGQVEGTKHLRSEYQAIKNKQVFLYLFGIIKYQDAFGKPHRTEFCVYLANPDTNKMGTCDFFNDLN